MLRCLATVFQVFLQRLAIPDSGNDSEPGTRAASLIIRLV